MNLARRTWALSALALTLVLGACSTPNDLASPTLEPQFGSEDNDYGIDMAVAPGGLIYLLSYEEEEYVSDYDGYSYGIPNMYLSRYDNNGNLLWKINIHDWNYDYGYYYSAPSVFTGSNGYAYVVASAEDYEGDAYMYVDAFDASGKAVKRYYAGCYYDARAAVDGNGYVFIACNGSVAKYSPAGSQLWKRSVTVGTPAAVTVSGSNVFVTGPKGVSRIASSNGNIAWTKSGAGKDIIAFGSSVYVRYLNTVRKLDSSGRQLWSKAQSGLNSMVVADMTTDKYGNIYLAGKYSVNSPDRNAFTRKLNTSGTTLYTKTFGTSVYDDARGIATYLGDGIYVTGATQGALAHPYKGGENDGYISKLNSSGSPVWTR